MDTREAKNALRDGTIAAGLQLIREDETQMVFQYDDVMFAITAEDVEEYAASADLYTAAKAAPVECGLLSSNYREQVVQPLDPMRWRYMPPLEMGFVFGEPENGHLYITLGAATPEFANYFRFDPAYLQICLERMARMPSADEPIDIRQGLYKPPTIQVHNLGEKDIDAALRHSSRVIEYCLFELSYLKQLPVGLADEWPARRRAGEDGFVFRESFAGNMLPLPPADFNADVVQFYQLGTSSRMPVLQFWAFYQVLEYFFIRASDEHLHRQLASRLKDPRFKPTSTQFDKLVQDVIDHVGATDEVVMLKSVIDKYVDEGELCEFIRKYEAYLGEKMYTKRRRIFSEDVEVKLVSGAVADGVAKTICAIHKALSFSADRTTRTARNIPYSRVAEAVAPEIPLMKFLAERVIIGSAS